MKTVRRWVFAIVAFVSFLLCAATAGMWVRSISTVNYDTISYSHCEVSFYRDGFVWLLMEDPMDDPGWRHEKHVELQTDSLAWQAKELGALSDEGFKFLDFAYYTRTKSGPVISPFRVTIAPYWMIVVATAILPLLWLLLWRSRRRRRNASTHA